MGGKLKKSENEAMAEYENDVELDTSDKKRDKRKKKNKEGEEKREILPSMIKNKEKRSVVHAKLKHLKKVEKRKKLKARDASEKRSLELGEEVLFLFSFLSLIFLSLCLTIRQCLQAKLALFFVEQLIE